MVERAVLVSAEFRSIRKSSSLTDLENELKELSAAAGLEIVESLAFRQNEPNAPLLLGRGKIEMIREAVKNKKGDVVIFDSDLSASQQRNVEEIAGVKTIDRTQLILDLFARRARSTEGKLQVELAQLKYLLPRLSGKGIYLSRLGGGVGTRGPGEQKLEVDRRRIREKIAKFSEELKQLEIKRTRAVEKKRQNDLPLVALVGYTNAGKSSLFNRLTEADALVKNQLFSTLDTTTRLFSLPRKQKALLADTVGFIRDLPHHLVESFKATLEEAAQADVLLHVMDASREDLDVIYPAVNQVLSQIGVHGKNIRLILNKIDAVAADRREKLMARLGEQAPPVFLVSARTGEGIETLLESLADDFSVGKNLREFLVPLSRMALVHRLYEEAEVIERKDRREGVYLKAYVSPKTESIFRQVLGSANYAN